MRVASITQSFRVPGLFRRNWLTGETGSGVRLFCDRTMKPLRFGSEGCGMFRITAGSLLALASVGVAGAGQIQIGGANGLTSSYIATGCSGTPPCVAGSLGSLSSATEGSYD